MPSQKPVTAIFDVGKTNKKFLLFDENLIVVEKHQTELEQSVDDDGDPCEDLKALEDWISDQIQTAQKRHKVRSINFSGYGASLVHLNKKGKPVTPLYNYLKEYPIDLLSEFYKSVGGKEEFSLQTASPPMGMLNSGLQLYWLKHQKREFFQNFETSLHFPNYLSYLFTGKKVSELTSIGCHTGMWNFQEMKYHQWIQNEGVKNLLPLPQPVSEITKTNKGMNAGPGIHDSSAALAPYLIGFNEPFMLISTGTWSITLNPFNDELLTYEELERDCLCYLDIFGNQVKASRFFLGAEYAYQKKKIENFFDIPDNAQHLDILLMNQLILNENPGRQLELEQAYNSGPFQKEKTGKWRMDHFSSAKEAYHQLMLDLVFIQAESIKLAEGSKDVEKLIITGGFSQNIFFVSLLASFFPDKEVHTSSLPDASALGAAMVLNENLIHAASPGSRRNRGNKLKELLGLNIVEPVKGLKVNRYTWKPS